MRGFVQYALVAVSALSIACEGYAPAVRGLQTNSTTAPAPDHMNMHKGSMYKSNHVVMIYGWGEDEATGKKFWHVRNSWGDWWGEKGNGRVIRGVNACGIEAMTTGVELEDIEDSSAELKD